MKRRTSRRGIVTEDYRAPHLWCTNEVDAPADGVIAAVNVVPDVGRSFLEIAQWQLLSGMDKPLKATFGGDVKSVRKSNRFTIESEEGKLVVADTADGHLEGTFTL